MPPPAPGGAGGGAAASVPPRGRAAQPEGAAAGGAGRQGGRGGQAPNAEPPGLYRSDDGGATWRKVNNANPRPMYFSQVRIDPDDSEVVYLGRRRAAPDARRRPDHGDRRRRLDP